MEFEKQYLIEHRIREVWALLGFFISDNSLVFSLRYFSFLPKKIEIKELQYRIRYAYYDNQKYWTNWEYGYKFKR